MAAAQTGSSEFKARPAIGQAVSAALSNVYAGVTPMQAGIIDSFLSSPNPEPSQLSESLLNAGADQAEYVAISDFNPLVRQAQAPHLTDPQLWDISVKLDILNGVLRSQRLAGTKDRAELMTALRLASSGLSLGKKARLIAEMERTARILKGVAAPTEVVEAPKPAPADSAPEAKIPENRLSLQPSRRDPETGPSLAGFEKIVRLHGYALDRSEGMITKLKYTVGTSAVFKRAYEAEGIIAAVRQTLAALKKSRWARPVIKEYVPASLQELPWAVRRALSDLNSRIISDGKAGAVRTSLKDLHLLIKLAAISPTRDQHRLRGIYQGAARRVSRL